MTDLTFECPRCGASVESAYYGPCPVCRTGLRATMKGAGDAVAAAEYEPKINVTPNAVALKDD